MHRAVGVGSAYKLYSGTGPIGLITAAVAHAYSARKIMGFDINPKRVEFARKYISPITGKPIFDHVFLNTAIPTTMPDEATNGVPNGHSHDSDESSSRRLANKALEQVSAMLMSFLRRQEADHDVPVGDIRWEHAKVRAAGWVEECGLTLEEGFDRVIEASGADDCGLLGCALAKQGGVCESFPGLVNDQESAILRLHFSPRCRPRPHQHQNDANDCGHQQGTRCQR